MTKTLIALHLLSIGAIWRRVRSDQSSNALNQEPRSKDHAVWVSQTLRKMEGAQNGAQLASSQFVQF
jgi:hypothetical protein